MGTVDLHMHSRASDGSYAPGELVRLAAGNGVEVLAVTDHDTVEGVPDAMRAGGEVGVEVLPGVELGCEVDGLRTDVLGYLFDLDDPSFNEMLSGIRQQRHERAHRMVQKLQAMGLPIEYERVEEISGGGAVGRPHVAHALVEAGVVEDVGSAFEEYIGLGRPAYEPHARLTPEDACRAVRAAGGVPVVAHPVPPSDPWSDPKHLRTFLPSLIEAGLGGLECYYPGYTARVVRWLEALAWHFKLVATGGTDYHGPWRSEMLPGGVDVPEDVPDRLREAAVRA